jgi:hypothetical protein
VAVSDHRGESRVSLLAPELNTRAVRSTLDSAAVEVGNPRVRVKLEDLRDTPWCVGGAAADQ